MCIRDSYNILLSSVLGGLLFTVCVNIVSWSFSQSVLEFLKFVCFVYPEHLILLVIWPVSKCCLLYTSKQHQGRRHRKTPLKFLISLWFNFFFVNLDSWKIRFNMTWVPEIWEPVLRTESSKKIWQKKNRLNNKLQCCLWSP